MYVYKYIHLPKFQLQTMLILKCHIAQSYVPNVGMNVNINSIPKSMTMNLHSLKSNKTIEICVKNKGFIWSFVLHYLHTIRFIQHNTLKLISIPNPPL